MKKLLWIVGIVVLLGIIGVLSLPFLIDLNKHRGEIISAVEEKLQGDFNIEELELRGLSIRIKGVTLYSKGPFSEKAILKVGEAKLGVSLMSLLSFNPKVTLRLFKPEIWIVKNDQGLLNLTHLMEKGAGEFSPSDGNANSGAAFVLPAFLLRSQVSFRADDARITYLDEKSGTSSTVRDLNLSVKNVSFDRSFPFHIDAKLASGRQEESFFEGNVVLDGTAKVIVGKDKKISGVELKSKLALGELTADIEGKIKDLSTLDADLSITTPELELSKLKASFVPLQKFRFDGTLSLNGKINGKLKDFDDCRVDARIHIRVKSHETDLIIKSTLTETLNNLKSEFVIESSLLNLDELLPEGEATESAQLLKFLFPIRTAFAQGEEEVSSAPKDPFKMFRENPMMKGLSANGRIDIKKIIYRKTPLHNLRGRIRFKESRLTFSRFGIQAFGGKIGFKGSLDLNPVNPVYRMTTVAQKLKLNPILTMGSPALKDFGTGTINANFSLNGQGFTDELIEAKMRGQGRLDLRNATFKGLNIGQSLQSELKLIEIFSGSDALTDSFSEKINSLKSSLVVKRGRLYTPDAVLIAPKYEAQMKGYVSFKKELNYSGKILIPAKQFSSRTIASLADSRGMVGFPFQLSGTIPDINFSVDSSAIARMAAEGTVRDMIKKKTGFDLPINLPF